MSAPNVLQGYLNRVLTHIVVPDYLGLSVTAPYMSKSLAVFTFEDDFVDQVPTATGLVNSPRPYVISQVVINLLRSQALAAAWLAQSQVASQIGTVNVYPDSTVLPYLSLANCSIINVDPGAFDGTDPTFKLTVKGIYYTNVELWSGAAA